MSGMVRTVVCLLMAALSMSAAQSAQRGTEPFVPVGMWYAGGTVQPPMAPREPAKEKEAWRRDLALMKTLGFNSVTSWVDWASAEPERGTYNFEALEQMLTLAGEIGLKVIVRVYTDAAPGWLGARYTDAHVILDEGRGDPAGAPGFCPDHPGVRSDLLAFIGAAARAASRHASLYAVALRSDSVIARARPGSMSAAFCGCPHTLARMRAWLAQRPGVAPTGGLEREAFISEARQADLQHAADTARAQGARIVAGYPSRGGVSGQKDRRMAASVDYYGTRLAPEVAAPLWPALGLTWALDRMSAEARERGWWLAELDAGEHTKPAHVTAADLRLRGWASYSRGARAIGYAGLTVQELAGPDGRPTARASAAGELAGNLTRNVRLFAPMRARRSRVAVVETPQPGAASQRAGPLDSIPAVYRATFQQNIQADVLAPEDLLAGAASKYAVVGVAPGPAPPVIEEVLKAYARDGGTVIREAHGEERTTIERIQRQVAAAGVTPDIRLDGAPGLVEARFLESPDALLLIAINHAATPQTVTMHFSPDTPEAIWQNMETGAAVHFVQRTEGPTYRHAFAARDVLVLVRGKRLR